MTISIPSTTTAPNTLTASCPSWCGNPHSERDYGDDLAHIGSDPDTDIPLTLQPLHTHDRAGTPTTEPNPLMVWLQQHFNEAEAHVEIATEIVGRGHFNLTLDEAERLATLLTATVAAARRAATA